LSDQIGAVFAALADPTRRTVVLSLLRDGSTSVPLLTASLPISRQAVAKHLAALEEAQLLERMPPAGREVRYRLCGEALAPATAWLQEAESAWEGRLGRLKRAVENAPER
jgi:ArsR family transcriptional regulator, cadmium/lead-responsive transcriptional repressor